MSAQQSTARAKGPIVYRDMDQAELDAAYDQDAYAPSYGIGYRIDARGWRVAEAPGPAGDGARWVGLGDSVLFGQGIFGLFLYFIISFISLEFDRNLGRCVEFLLEQVGHPGQTTGDVTGLGRLLRDTREHVADLDVIDDFPMLWTWFEEDRILSERLGQPRLHTDTDGYFKYRYLWHLLIERICLEYHKRLRDDPSYHEHTTTVVEFSRGDEHGGYAEAFPYLAEDLLRRAAAGGAA